MQLKKESDKWDKGKSKKKWRIILLIAVVGIVQKVKRIIFSSG